MNISTEFIYVRTYLNIPREMYIIMKFENVYTQLAAKLRIH